LLSARNISFSYRTRSHTRPVVHDVSLDVGPGTFVGVLGPNGSGKTTLLKLLTGVLVPASGSVTLDGASIDRESRRSVARKVAVVAQDTHPAFDYTVLELVLMGRYPHLGAFAIEGPDDVRIAREALASTDMLGFEHRLFSSLSGGEKQRVVIASALAQQAALLLLDEPTASLDPGHQLDIAQLLTRLHAERGLGLVLSTHDLNLAASVCRELVLLQEGRIIARGRTEDVLTEENIERLYGVRADVRYHEGAGHLTVVPIPRGRS
jgi:iron complex transport system ATP-binding protein